MIAETPDGARLRRLWHEHRAAPFPAATTADPRLQEVALFESWLGSIVEAALSRGGRLGAAHMGMVRIREAEGNQAMWALAGELGEPARSYVARLLAIEDVVRKLPADT